MLNPYTWRTVVRDPDMFYGREQELAEVASRLHGKVPLNISVIGSRRMGKSSLLWHISRSSSRALPPDVYERCIFIHLDFQEAGKLSTAKLLKWILGELTVKAELSVLDEDSLKDLLREKLTVLEQENMNLVLVFDEFDSAVRYISTETLDYLRALAKYNLAYIVATKQPLSEICTTLEASPFSNIFTVLPLGLLPWQEAYSLVVGPSAREGVNFTHKDIDFILDTAGSHPYLLQVVSYYTFESRSNHAGPLDYTEIKKQASEDVMPFIQRKFYSLLEERKDAVVGMIHGQRPSSSMLDELRRQGIVSEDNKLFCSLFKRFVSTLVAEREQKRTSESLLEEVDRLLKQLERQMRESLKRHLETKYGPNWPNNLQKRNPSKFQEWLQRMPEEPRSSVAGWQNILRYTDFPDPFQIIRYEWGDLKGIFSFSKDANKSKRRLEERQEFLTRVRNVVKHSREEDLTDLELEKARLFCKELLAILDSTQLDVRPREFGDGVPLQVQVVYADEARHPHVSEQTQHVSVARTEATHVTQNIHITSGGGAVVVGDVTPGRDFTGRDSTSGLPNLDKPEPKRKFTTENTEKDRKNSAPSASLR